MTEKEISDLIYNELCYMYCDNCRYNSELPNEDACDDCHRKSNGWGISRSESNYIASEIMKRHKKKSLTSLPDFTHHTGNMLDYPNLKKCKR